MANISQIQIYEDDINLNLYCHYLHRITKPYFFSQQYIWAKVLSQSVDVEEVSIRVERQVISLELLIRYIEVSSDEDYIQVNGRWYNITSANIIAPGRWITLLTRDVPGNQQPSGTVQPLHPLG